MEVDITATAKKGNLGKSRVTQHDMEEAKQAKAPPSDPPVVEFSARCVTGRETAPATELNQLYC